MKLFFKLIKPRYFISLFNSIYHYFRYLRKDVDLILYAPVHFNRGANSENIFFEPLLKYCEKHKLKYVFINEVDYSKSFNNHPQSIRADWLVLLVIFMRKLLKGEYSQSKQQRIGRLLKKLFPIKPKSIIVMSQSMIGVFRGVFPQSKIYDLQHGIIHRNHPAYLSASLKENATTSLVFGAGFKKILQEISPYYKESLILGVESKNKDLAHKAFNNKVLLSLQFTEDHTLEENQILLDDLKGFFQKLETLKSPIEVYVRNHPRFNNEVDLSFLDNYNFVHNAPPSLDDCFKMCSLNVTAYSSVVFDAAAFGVPTVFYSDSFNIFKTEYEYPCNLSISEVLSHNYDSISLKAKKWYEEYYTTFDEDTFFKILQ